MTIREPNRGLCCQTDVFILLTRRQHRYAGLLVCTCSPAVCPEGWVSLCIQINWWEMVQTAQFLLLHLRSRGSYPTRWIQHHLPDAPACGNKCHFNDFRFSVVQSLLFQPTQKYFMRVCSSFITLFISSEVKCIHRHMLVMKSNFCFYHFDHV